MAIGIRWIGVALVVGLLGSRAIAVVPEADQLVAGKVAVVKGGKLAKIKSKGTAYLPIVNDPTVDGATLVLFDTNGGGGHVSYPLPASGWQGDQTKGFRYKGSGTVSDPCKVVSVNAKILKAICKGSGVVLAPPFSGDLAAVLEIGSAGKKYCAQFPPVKNNGTLFKGKDAPPPPACPVTAADILPEEAERLPGGTQQFVVATGPEGPYTWSVNDIDGGDAINGTIDASGFYTAPGAVPSPATFSVCARSTALPWVSDCSSMTINAIPSPGEDVVVFNDINVLDDSSLTNPNNVLMVHNLLSYTTIAARAGADTVLLDGGHGSVCGSALCGGSFTLLVSQVGTEGYVLNTDTSGDLSSIAPNVKVLVLWLPSTIYTTAEINGMKQFASEGGRIVFVGEHAGFYGAGFAAQNDFLTKMGAVMTNVGNFIDCGYNTLPFASLRAHQVTTGMTDVTMACSSEITLGPNDFALYYDSTNTRVLSGVAKIDTVPLPAAFTRAAVSSSDGPPATHDAIGNPLP